MARINRQNRIANKFKYIFILTFIFMSQLTNALDVQKTESLDSVNSGLFGKELTEHNQDADISFRGDQGLKKDDFYDLTGHVFLKQDNTSLNSETARLYYSKKSSSPNSTSKMGRSGVERAIAKGNVKISKTVSPISPAFKADADEVELLVPQHKLILRGQAKFWRGDEFIHAEIITIDLDTNDISLQEPRGTFAAKKMEQAKTETSSHEAHAENNVLPSTPTGKTP